MEGPEALARMEKLGYWVSFTEGKLVYRYIGTGTPDSSEVTPLLKALKKDRDAVIATLQARKNSDGRRILDLSLREFRKSKRAIRIFSELLGQDVWLGPNSPLDKGRVSYSATELEELMRLEPRAEEITLIHSIKEEFRGAKIERVNRGRQKFRK